MERVKPLNIVVLPDNEVANIAVEISQQIADNVSTYFTLDVKVKRPHITIYQAPFPEKNIDKLMSALEEVAQQTSPMLITLHKTSVVAETFIFWNAKVTPELMALHQKVVLQTNTLRGGHIPTHLKSVPLEKADARDVKQYGLPMVLDRYVPHITLTRISDPNDATRITKIIGTEVTATFQAISICVCTLGDHGTTGNVLKEFHLSHLT